jgi:chromosome segregation ATPase
MERANTQSDQKRIAELNSEVDQLHSLINKRQKQGPVDCNAGLYATLSDKYMELHRLKSSIYAFEWSIESLDKAVDMAGESDLQYLAKRVEIYIDAYHYRHKAEEDLAKLREALSIRSNPALSSADRAYLQSVCEKVDAKLKRFREMDDALAEIDDARAEIAQMKRWMHDRQSCGEQDGGTLYKALSDLYMKLFELNNDKDAFDSAMENINEAIRLEDVEWEKDRSKFYEYVVRRAELCIDANAYEDAKRDIATLRNEMSKTPSVLDKHANEAKALQEKLKALQEQLKPLEVQYDNLKKQISHLRDVLSDKKWAVGAAKKAPNELQKYIDSLGEKLAAALESSESTSTRSPQGGGRTRRARRSSPIVERKRRMTPISLSP